MSSMKSRKMNMLVLKSLVAATGVLMFAFQNCSRIDTMQVSDIAGKVVGAKELAGSQNQGDEMNVQIELENGTVLSVDDRGNQTVVEQQPVQQQPVEQQPVSQQPVSQQPAEQQPVQQQPVNDQPILVTETESSHDGHANDGGHSTGHENEVDENDHDDSDDLDYCEAIKEQKPGAILAVMQKIKCKKRDKKHREKRCIDLVREHGVNAIDLAKLDDVKRLKSPLRGKTVIYSSDVSRSFAKEFIVENAVGKTILCGVSIARLDIKKGNLELREGAKIKSCGEIKGRIYKDEQSSIDGSID